MPDLSGVLSSRWRQLAQPLSSSSWLAWSGWRESVLVCQSTVVDQLVCPLDAPLHLSARAFARGIRADGRNTVTTHHHGERGWARDADCRVPHRLLAVDR